MCDTVVWSSRCSRAQGRSQLGSCTFQPRCSLNPRPLPLFFHILKGNSSSPSVSSICSPSGTGLYKQGALEVSASDEIHPSKDLFCSQGGAQPGELSGA